jgi:hypothetical protein
MKAQFINEERLGYMPKVIYHFTKKENLESIMKDRIIKHFSDVYTFYCPTEWEAKWFLYNVTCNPKATTVGADGVKKQNNNKIDEFVLLKIIPDRIYLDNNKWFKSNSTRNDNVDRHVICYKGNVRIKNAEIYELNEVDVMFTLFMIWIQNINSTSGYIKVNDERITTDDFINTIFKDEQTEVIKVKFEDNEWNIEDNLGRKFNVA